MYFQAWNTCCSRSGSSPRPDHPCPFCRTPLLLLCLHSGRGFLQDLIDSSFESSSRVSLSCGPRVWDCFIRLNATNCQFLQLKTMAMHGLPFRERDSLKGPRKSNNMAKLI